MHVLFTQSHGLDDQAQAYDLAQDPADLIVLSFSDSDLGAFAAGWKRADGSLPSLRLANLIALKHPASVDLWAEKTLCGARAILVRLIGGETYWPYGLATLQDLARRQGIALAVLPADGRPDDRLDALSTLPLSTLRRLQALCDAGGAVAAQAALAQLALAAGIYAGPVAGEKTVPDMGFYDPDQGVVAAPDLTGQVLVTFYRSYLTAADTAPVDALIRAFRAAGQAAIGAFAPSLKSPGVADWLGAALANPPAAVVNATAFSARDDNGATPFDAAGCPVFQVALSTARRRDWAASARGLSPADLAMHVVLPEVDGRLFAGIVSFKSPGQRDPDLQFSRFSHRADDRAVAQVVDRVTAWLRLSKVSADQKSTAIVLSSYPGKAHQLAHAVGLDALASAGAVLQALAKAGHDADPQIPLATTLPAARQVWPLAAYKAALATLPQPLQDALTAAWGPPEADATLLDGAFGFMAIWSGRQLIAAQPERGTPAQKTEDYHDTARVPSHAYVAFYLWLQSLGIHALVHMGAHGTLEWLPGKSVALSETCWPQALTRGLPVVYPFIVNDPGEAAQAKRRIGAVTLGHLPPPMATAALPDGLIRLERLLDEYSTADGLDPAGQIRLIGAIRAEAEATGLAADLGIPATASEAEMVTRIDRFVCDIKESRFGDGLHVFGSGDCGAQEMAGLLTALRGAHVRPGPSGSPNRGRSDVLPTGRNLFSVDPRAVPTKSAHAMGIKMAEDLIRRHVQDHGDYPRGLVVDLWGSATMRTSGEDFAMALHLAGLAPRWDDGSGRVSGFDILPLAMLGRPRIDVTLRVSGLFRDIFSGLGALFEQGVAALSQRDEAPEDNPYLSSGARVYAPAPGSYGLGMGAALDEFSDAARAAAGEAWLSASSWAFGADGALRADRIGIETRLRQADTFLHAQDLPETDVLMAADYAAHEAGFAAAMASLGAAKPTLYHLDATRPDALRLRTLPEEIARVVRARAANPDWADGMMRHGFRGAAEIAATLDHMAAFAHLAASVPAHLFDLYHDATLGRDAVRDFLAAQNPGALAAMEDTFRRLAQAGLWTTRRNSIAAAVAGERL